MFNEAPNKTISKSISKVLYAGDEKHQGLNTCCREIPISYATPPPRLLYRNEIHWKKLYILGALDIFDGYRFVGTVGGGGCLEEVPLNLALVFVLF